MTEQLERVLAWSHHKRSCSRSWHPAADLCSLKLDDHEPPYKHLTRPKPSLSSNQAVTQRIEESSRRLQQYCQTVSSPSLLQPVDDRYKREQSSCPLLELLSLVKLLLRFDRDGSRIRYIGKKQDSVESWDPGLEWRVSKFLENFQTAH